MGTIPIVSLHLLPGVARFFFIGSGILSCVEIMLEFLSCELVTLYLIFSLFFTYVMSSNYE